MVAKRAALAGVGDLDPLLRMLQIETDLLQQILLVAESETREVDLSVEEAFKLVMSAGLVTPSTVRSEATPDDRGVDRDAASSDSDRASETAAQPVILSRFSGRD